MAATAWSERQPDVPSPSMRIRCPQCGSYLREMAYAAGSFTVLACGPCGKSYRLNSTPRFGSTRHEGEEVQLVLRLE
jgi:DNA-directed RNA polymerase subunit RPC12/RpoP